ncbi:tetratricopeptide repeat protein [Lentzea flaviverrucosa]|uniref:Tetratricopeptide repeat-containing protein n=1 Tax=Lentzea flaviverrucosa TaxID=200379 RepID=A0A1H9FAH1_9PSEU|nr:hypothetical protein [Lentzea flaviverrucosa]RDI35256.1 hypothetical protein DFR72_1011007 [Lentzea flaviverrucosa]SEQ34920.1 hypothetical protein SAMN05216195_102210 [Lentzea flaviverrucosa]
MTGPSISGWSPARLGVHQAVEVSGAADRTKLPPYVIRAHDHNVRKALRGKEPFVVLTGTSCTGKTRTAFEAVRAELADLPLFRPLSANDLVRHMPDHPAVVWLNEIHHYLVEDAAVEALDAVLHIRGLVVVGTTLTDRWSELNEKNGPYPAARELLVAAYPVEVPESFDGDALTRLHDAGRHDPRLAYAAKAATDGKVIQALAGGPELVRAYRDPANAVANALVTTTIQASLLLGGGPVPVAVVREAAPAYLDSHDRASGASWFADADALAAAPVHGISALTKSREQLDMGEADHYRAHEFLVQHFRSLPSRVVPAALWEAMLTHLGPTGERAGLASSATHRGLLRLAARTIHPVTRELEGAELMTWKVVQRDHPDHLTWLRAAAALGSITSMHALAMQQSPEDIVWWQRLVQRTEALHMHEQLLQLKKRGLLEHALQWLGPARDAGNPEALTATLRLLVALKRYDEAVELALPFGDDPLQYFWLSDLYQAKGENAKATAVLRRWAEAGDWRAMLLLARLLRVDEPDESRRWRAEGTVAAKNELALRRRLFPLGLRRYRETRRKHDRLKTARQLVKHGDVVAAAAVWQEDAELGDGHAQHSLAELRMNNGESEEAERWFRAAAQTGEPRYRDALASFLASTERLPEALRMWNEPALLDDPDHLRHRFDALIRAGRADEAMAQVIELAEEGSLAAMRLLTDVMSEPEATKWKHRMARAGAVDIAHDLARTDLAEGRALAAERLLRSVPSRDQPTEALLREALVALGQNDEAERLLRASVERGDESLNQLVAFLRTRGRDAEANQVDLYGIEVGGSTAEPWSFKPLD